MLVLGDKSYPLRAGAGVAAGGLLLAIGGVNVLERDEWEFGSK